MTDTYRPIVLFEVSDGPPQQPHGQKPDQMETKLYLAMLVKIFSSAHPDGAGGQDTAAVFAESVDLADTTGARAAENLMRYMGLVFLQAANYLRYDLSDES